MKHLRIYFGYSRSKRYHQALEALKDFSGHTEHNDGDPKKAWHEVLIDPKQVDFLAFIYRLTLALGYDRLPKSFTNWHFKDSVYAGPGSVFDDHDQIKSILEKHGYLEFLDSHGNSRATDKIPPDPIPRFQKIRDAIEDRRYEDALNLYYKQLGKDPFGPLHPELVYLKRLAKINLSGRDLLYFRPESTIDKFLNEHLNEYIRCIDLELAYRKKSAAKTPLDILLRDVPTIDVLKKWKTKFQKQQVLIDEKGNVRRSDFGSGKAMGGRYGEVKQGRLFSVFPNPFLCSRKYIFRSEVFEKLWVVLSPEIFNRKVKERNLIAVQFRGCYRRRRNQQSVDDIESFGDLKRIDSAGMHGAEYTGRRLKIGRNQLFEIQRGIHPYSSSGDNMIVDRNPFLDLCNEILRDGENRLRERHGIPKIGEGWVSETKLFSLVKSLFEDAVQHARPKWLSPQHLDIYVPSKSLAIEYHGKQHFESVEFFGGTAHFLDTQARDRRKRERCKKNKIKLIEWHYDQQIDGKALRTVLEKYKVK